LASLRSLDLGWTEVSPAGLKELAGMKDLRTLNLCACLGVSDGALKKLNGMTSLEWLDITADSSVTDAGISELAGLKNLQTLRLGWTKATDRGIADFQRKLPKCKVEQ
jgi:hypothetical protein